MKYKRRTSHNITEDFLNQLLYDRGILHDNDEFKEKFFKPTKENLIDPILLDNMEKGYKLLKKHLEAGSRIYLVIDSDTDGITSSSLFYNYLTDNLKDKYNFTIDYHVPDGKEHGLSTLMNIFEGEKKWDLIVIPDAGSNDIEESNLLQEKGYDILTLDHHIASKYPESMVLINNQLSENYENKMLSGVGVVYKFFSFFDKMEGTSFADNYLDLVALGEISDMMEMGTLENRFICEYGLSHIKNKFFKELIEKQSYSLGAGPLTQIGIAFYITPLINALIRMGSNIEKERLFQAFITPDILVPSTKRGEKDQMETISTQSVRNCVNAKARQNREKDKAIELFDIQILNNNLDENKILILNADDMGIPNTLTGLCAMGIAAKYKKPTLLGRTCSDGYFRGSARGCADSELKDLRQFLLDSNLMEYAEGHAQAFGQSIKLKDIDRLTEYANEKLADIDFNEGFYEADFIVKGNCSYLSDLIEVLSSGKPFYGQGCPEPIIIIEDIPLNTGNYSIIGKNNDTLRFEFNGITYLKFKATKLIEELKQKSGKLCITAAGKGNVNEWGGRKSNQIFIDEIEIKESNSYDF